jgi:SAM-dependent methyltransferase
LPEEVGAGYDVVLLADVIEHVSDPSALLSEAVERLAPGGSLLVSIPNFGHWYPRLKVVAGVFDYEERGILDRTHLRFFTRRSFLRLVSRVGLQVVRQEPVGVPAEMIATRPDAAIVRFAKAAERLAVDAWPSMFAYQFLYELAPLAPAIVTG